MNDFTYLGVIFGKRAGWSRMEKKLSDKVQAKIAKILTLHGMFGIDVDSCIRIWNSIGRPVMEYAAEIWGTREPRVLEKQRRRLGRYLLAAPKNTNAEVIKGELGFWAIKASETNVLVQTVLGKEPTC